MMNGKTTSLPPVDFAYGIGSEEYYGDVQTTPASGGAKTVRSSSNLDIRKSTISFGYFTNGSYENIEAFAGMFSPYENEDGLVYLPEKDYYRLGKLSN